MPKWWGWSKIQPAYTAHIKVPGGLRSVQIDTSYRLADADWSDNYYGRRFWGKEGQLTRFDWGYAHPVDRRHYRGWIRPDLWWNAVDGLKPGVHYEGDYLGLLHKVDGTIWLNTHVLQRADYEPRGGESNYSRYALPNFSVSFATPITKRLPKLGAEYGLRYLEGLSYIRLGISYATSANSKLSLYALDVYRRRAEDLDYLIYPNEWSSTGERPNSSGNLAFNTTYNRGNSSGTLRALLRAPFLAGNRSDAFNYNFAQLEATNNLHLGKLDLRTRFFGRYGMGTSIPYESALFAGGANPEAMMENKYTRSIGLVPDAEEWRGFSRYEPTHFQYGGGLNLRGYTGYYIRDEREGEMLTGYKSRSGVALNAELDFERIIKLAPKLTKNWLHMDAYVFGDAGISELSRYNAANITIVYPTEMWSDVRVDAGLGLAATIKKWGPFDQARPLTIRVDFPVFLNRPPYGNPQYAAFRWLIGVERAF